jgi:hypothetical protein
VIVTDPDWGVEVGVTLNTGQGVANPPGTGEGFVQAWAVPEATANREKAMMLKTMRRARMIWSVYQREWAVAVGITGIICFVILTL